MTYSDLPPLPAGESVYIKYDTGSGTEFATTMYTADQMTAYALQTIEELIRGLRNAEFEALKGRNTIEGR